MKVGDLIYYCGVHQTKVEDNKPSYGIVSEIDVETGRFKALWCNCPDSSWYPILDKDRDRFTIVASSENKQ